MVFFSLKFAGSGYVRTLPTEPNQRDSLGIQVSHTEKSREITASEEGQTGRAFVRVNYHSSYFFFFFLQIF